MNNKKNNHQSSERRKEKNNSDAPRKYGRKNFRPKSDAPKRRKSDDGSIIHFSDLNFLNKKYFNK